MKNDAALAVIRQIWNAEGMTRYGELEEDEIKEAYLHHALAFVHICPNYAWALGKAYGLEKPKTPTIGHCNLRTRIFYALVSQNAANDMCKEDKVVDWPIAEEWKKLDNILRFFNEPEKAQKILCAAAARSDAGKDWDIVPYLSHHKKPVKDLPVYLSTKHFTKLCEFWVQEGNDA